jgi:CO/xanthine dehydrogenase Mo-binding subunit
MLDSVARVTGAVAYLVNLRLPNMLVGKIVRGAVPHARLLNVDASRAAKVPGVVAVLTGADLRPGTRYGVAIRDQGVVAQDRVRFIGEPIAAVAAEDAAAAEEAALIEIEYEELPAVFDALTASRPGAPVLHEAFPDNIFKHAKLRRGDVGPASPRRMKYSRTRSPARPRSRPHSNRTSPWRSGRATG